MGRKTRQTSLRSASRQRPVLNVEHLECRLNLSTVVDVPAHAAATPVQSTVVRYRIDAWSQGAGANVGQYGNSYVNTQFAQAQQFFNKFKKQFPNYGDPAPPPPNNNPPPPPPPSTTTDPVTIRQIAEGSINRLEIDGTSGNDYISVWQSGTTYTVNANGTTSTVTGIFGELAIEGGAGDDTITVQSSVNITCLLYGGSGTNVLSAGGSAKSYIVTLGAGSDTLNGNGVNTSYWADSGDTVNASATETSNGDVHRVTSFYQPFSSTPGTPGYISTSLDGANLPDPTDSGSTHRLTASLWGTGPVMADVNQGGVGDCYYLSTIQSLAFAQPAKLQEMAVDLGDGTYAVQYKRGGTTTYVRVDGDLPNGYWNGGLAYAHPLGGGPIWAAIFEKAYAFFRTASNTYDSLNFGWTGSVFTDLGVANTTFSTWQSNLYNVLATALANHKAIAVITNSTVASGIPIIGSHAYSVVGVSTVSGVQYVTVRNPWGVDGAGSDSNTNDGLGLISMTQFNAAFTSGSIMN